MTHQLIQEYADLATSLDLLEKWVQHTMHKQHQPGVAIGLVYDSDLLWGKGFGIADIEKQTPVTLETRFRIASITKTFTATAILKLRDEGKLQLEDSVEKHVDWFTQRYLDAPPPTIRNLLTHTSGLPRDAVGPMWTDLDSPSYDEFVDETKTRDLTQPPYNKFAYSNLGYAILGMVIEKMSGLSWAEYLQANILDPLGMTSTVPLPQADDEGLATGYTKLNETYARDPIPFMDMGGFAPSTNFASNITDLVKYAKFHLSEGQTPVLSGHTLRDMHRIHWIEDDWQSGYGLGLENRRINDWIITGHGGGYPGYLTSFSLCRNHNFGAIVLTNSIDGNPYQYVEQCYKLVLPEILKATDKGDPEADPAWQQYVGTYANRWDEIEVVIRNNQLQMVSLDWITDDPIILIPTDEAHVFILKQPGDSNETARFEFDDDGNIVKLWERNEYYLSKQ